MIKWNYARKQIKKITLSTTNRKHTTISNQIAMFSVNTIIFNQGDKYSSYYILDTNRNVIVKKLR